MSHETLDSYIRQLLEPQDASEVTIAWQGGEPTLMGLEFFKRSIEVVARYQRPGQKILHTLQTNGVLLDDNPISARAGTTILRLCRSLQP